MVRHRPSARDVARPDGGFGVGDDTIESERLMAQVLDGVAIAAAIKKEVGEEVQKLAAQSIRPGLAAVLVGHVPASEIYVRSKVQTCSELGLFSEKIGR